MEIQTTTCWRRAFTLTELLVIIAMVAVLVAMLLPANSGPHRAQRINCINNLKEDGLAFKMWANDHDGKYPMQVSMTNGGAMEFTEKGIAFPIFQVMSNELSMPKILYCPADTKASAAIYFTNLNNSNISYFVGLDSTEDNPNSMLMGDDNFAVNGKPVSSGILNLQPKSDVEYTDERHHRAGNIALADGSAWQVDDKMLAQKLIETSASTNRLVIP